jgi:hypothetical protein
MFMCIYAEIEYSVDTFMSIFREDHGIKYQFLQNISVDT